MPFVVVNEARLHYQLVGSGSPLLFIHGLGSSGRDWEKQVSYFQFGHTVLTVDLRGHGQSDKPAGPYSIRGFSADVAAVLSELELEPVAVVGISLGGMVAFQMAADHPQFVDRLVAVNALPGFRLETVGQRVQVLARRAIVRFMGMEKMGEVLAGRLFPDEANAEDRATMVKRWAENDKRAYREAFAAILAWGGVEEAMSGFDKPILVIASDEDYLPVSFKQPYVDAMPAAEMVIIGDARHAVPAERPERFNAVLEEFLA